MQIQNCLSAAVAGTGASANLVAAATGKSIRVWQLVVAGTTTDTASIVFKVNNVSTTMKAVVTNNCAVFPASGVPWCTADAGTGVTFTAAATTTVTAYYTLGIGG